MFYVLALFNMLRVIIHCIDLVQIGLCDQTLVISKSGHKPTLMHTVLYTPLEEQEAESVVFVLEE